MAKGGDSGRIGEHFCLGASLARFELNAIFERIIPRLRNPELAGPLRRLRSNFVNRMKEMRIRFDPEGGSARAVRSRAAGSGPLPSPRR